MRLNLSADGLRTLAELMLAMVLFTDAANADLDIGRRNIGIAARLLLIGLPLTIVLGFSSPMVLLPGIGPLEMALLADRRGIRQTGRHQSRCVREALNIECGLNDGICEPIVVLLLGLAVGNQYAAAIRARCYFLAVRTRGDRPEYRTCSSRAYLACVTGGAAIGYSLRGNIRGLNLVSLSQSLAYRRLLSMARKADVIRAGFPIGG